jgi:CDP-diacylglycerol--glycerol-3-phosphate 3-phosphatidyltransferase
LVLLPFAILTTTYMISYQRSKAESLGLAAKGGLMERAERMILLGIGMLAKPIFIPVLWIMLFLTAMTAAGRFWRIWQIAASPDPPMMQAGRIHHSNRLRRGLSRTSRP